MNRSLIGNATPHAMPSKILGANACSARAWPRKPAQHANITLAKIKPFNINNGWLASPSATSSFTSPPPNRPKIKPGSVNASATAAPYTPIDQLKPASVCACTVIDSNAKTIMGNVSAFGMRCSLASTHAQSVSHIHIINIRSLFGCNYTVLLEHYSVVTQVAL